MTQEETKNVSTSDDAKVEIDPDEPTDEREERIHFSDNAVEEGVQEEVEEETAKERKQIHMKVDADAPWKDRMWEGME